MSGGDCPGGDCPRGDCPGGDCPGWGEIVPGGGIIHGAYCPGGGGGGAIVRGSIFSGAIVRIPIIRRKPKLILPAVNTKISLQFYGKFLSTWNHLDPNALYFSERFHLLDSFEGRISILFKDTIEQFATIFNHSQVNKIIHFTRNNI